MSWGKKKEKKKRVWVTWLGRTSFFFFWSILDDSETSAQPEENDQTAVSKRLLDGASHACCAGDLQIGRGHDSGVPGGDSDPGAGERPSKTQTARRWNWDMARLAPHPPPPCLLLKANGPFAPFYTLTAAAHVRRSPNGSGCWQHEWNNAINRPGIRLL